MVILGTFHYPESPILFQKEDTKAIVDGADLGNGTVYISERLVSWNNHQGLGFSVDYANISLHAITTDPNVYHTKCLYVMIDGRLTLQGCEPPNLVPVNGSTDHSDSDSESDCEPEPSRLLLVPTDLDSVNNLFTALSHGQSLNPDPQDCLDEEDEDDNIYDDAECFSDGMMVNQAYSGDDINNLTSQLQNNSIQYSHENGDNGDLDDNQFEDAD